MPSIQFSPFIIFLLDYFFCSLSAITCDLFLFRKRLISRIYTFLSFVVNISMLNFETEINIFYFFLIGINDY